MNKYSARSGDLFLETPMGIVTRTGDWFHTTTEQIEQYVPGLLAKRSLESLVEEGIAWVRSADSLALSLLLILILFIHPLLAASIAFAIHFFWYRSKSAFVTIYMGKVLKFINSDGYQLILALVIISAVGMNGQYLAAGVGLVFFFLMKLGLLKKLWDKLDEGTQKELSLNDRVFKMLLIKYAMHYNMAHKHVQKMEERFKEMAMNRKKGKE
jgi:hypothetical protein